MRACSPSRVEKESGPRPESRCGASNARLNESELRYIAYGEKRDTWLRTTVDGIATSPPVPEICTTTIAPGCRRLAVSICAPPDERSINETTGPYFRRTVLSQSRSDSVR